MRRQSLPARRRAPGVLAASALFALAGSSTSLHAEQYAVSVDTGAVFSSQAALAFDFIDGGAPANEIQLQKFTTDGLLVGPSQLTGDASGNVSSAARLGDAVFFNEVLQLLSLGNGFGFVFSTTAAAPAQNAMPDTFSFFLLDAVTGLPLFATTDPTGADALFIYEIGGSSQGNLSVYQSADSAPMSTWSVTEVSSIPEPATLALAALGLCGGLCGRVRAARSRRSLACLR